MFERLGFMGWSVGRGRGDITTFIPGIVMLGYGNPKNTVTEVETPLTARVFWLESESTSEHFLYINLEVCFITQSLTDAIWKEFQNEFSALNIPRKNLMFTAQHTHSAPSGYTHYALYNVPTEGFSPQVLNTIVQGVSTAIKQARACMRPSKVLLKRGSFPLSTDVSFNRSLEAYNANPEVQPKLTTEEQNKAVDREMRILEIVDDEGPSGIIGIFAVHPTNIIWTNHLISPGNKGYASLYLEDHFKKKGRKDYLAIFAQGNAGDVSPIYTPKWFEHMIPKSDQEMVEKSKANGKLQYLGALDFLNNEGVELEEGSIDSELIYIDMSSITCDQKHISPQLKGTNAVTSPATLGVAFMGGAEGAGIGLPLKILCQTLITCVRIFEYLISPLRSKRWRTKVFRKYRSQSPKFIFVETGEKKVLGTSKIMSLVIPDFADQSIRYFKKIHKMGGAGEHSWTQQILPIQISILGGYAFIGIPAETSTMAGERIKNALYDVLKERVKEVILCPYANSYCGYITTPEEYEHQCYEGGHTVFGKWTQPAFQTKLCELATEMLKPKEERVLDKSLVPPQFSESELKVRTLENLSLYPGT
ncbi:MAG: neutral/alkaline non-lysosomal ceramidase N-terminal domain-containing protein [Bacteriovoracaceae bacterium]|nr:neutral/alkaline non-lysosomal ceramidase N-terminal domain-containing protein [Bacteriovoracaceae bacterium]